MELTWYLGFGDAKGLGGAGPFLTYVGFNAATFDLTTRALTQPQKCTVFDESGSVCVTQEGSSSLKVVRSSGTETLTMEPAIAEYGVVSVSATDVTGVWRVCGGPRLPLRLLRDHGRGFEHRRCCFHPAGFRSGGVAR